MAKGEKYLKEFGLSLSPTLKAISFLKVYDNISDCPTDNQGNIDVLIIPDRVVDLELIESEIKRFTTFNSSVCLMLHDGDSNKRNKADIVSEVAGMKLIHPILQEHSDHGITYQFLWELSLIWKKRQKKEYYSKIQSFNGQPSSMDLSFEAKLELWSSCSTQNEIERLLNGEFQNNFTSSYLKNLLLDDNIFSLVQELRDCSQEQYFELKIKLKNYLFKE